MPKLFIFDAFTLLIREKTVANYALLRCKTFSLKIWVCKIFDKFHVWGVGGVTKWHGAMLNGGLRSHQIDGIICEQLLVHNHKKM